MGATGVLDNPSSATGLPDGVQGDVLYHDGSDWVVLNAGVAGRLLQTLGPGADPVWVAGAGADYRPLVADSFIVADDGDADEKAIADIQCTGVNDEADWDGVVAANFLARGSKGQYEFASVITVDQLDFLMEGLDRKLTTLFRVNTTPNDIIAVTAAGFTFRRFLVNGNRANQTDSFHADFIDIGNAAADDGVVEDSRFLDCGYQLGGAATENATISFNADGVKNWVFRHLQFDGCEAGIFCTKGGTDYDVSEVRVHDIYSFEVGDTGPSGEGDGNALIHIGDGKNWAITNIVHDHGFYVAVDVFGNTTQPAHNISITNVVVEDNDDGDAFRFFHAYNCVLVGCVKEVGDQGLISIFGESYGDIVSACAMINHEGQGITVSTLGGEVPRDIILTSLFMGDSASASGSAIRFNPGVTFAILANSIFRDIDQVQASGLIFETTAGLVVSGNIFHDTRAGSRTMIGPFFFSNCTDILYVGNYHEGLETNGLQIGDMSDSLIAVCLFNGADDRGIRLSDGNNNHIIGCRIHDTINPIVFDDADVVNPVVIANNWEGSTNDLIDSGAVDPRLHSNIDKDGNWYIVDDFEVLRKVWIANDILNPSIVTVPANSFVSVEIWVEEAFDDAATLNVGYDADNDSIVDAVVLTATGRIATIYGVEGGFMGISRAIEAYVTGTPTVGKASILFKCTTFPAEVA